MAELPQLVLVGIGLVLFIMGFFAGVFFRKAQEIGEGGGNSAAALKERMQDYETDVTEHMQTSAQILSDMAEGVLAMRDHLVAGGKLCNEDLVDTRLRLAQDTVAEAIAAPADDAEPEAAETDLDELTGSTASDSPVEGSDDAADGASEADAGEAEDAGAAEAKPA